jgi:signal transduction histidine kinase/pSer/pThr/pTyr-binding forkhead associated (FHA) protein
MRSNESITRTDEATAKLMVKSGQHKGMTYKLGQGAVTIGREPSNTIVLPDNWVSRTHARIIQEGEECLIEDLGSVNGTRVNNRYVTRQSLKRGDMIALGGTILQFLPVQYSERRFTAGDMGSVAVRVAREEDFSAEHTVELTVTPKEAGSFPGVVDRADLEKAYERLTVIYELIKDLVSETDLPKLLNGILEKVLKTVNADRGLIMLLDEQSGALVPEAACKGENLPGDEEIVLSKTISGRVLETGQSILTLDAMRDDRFEGSESIAMHKVRSTMCVPIKSKNRVLGIMHVDTKRRLASFTQEDLELLTAMGLQAGMVIENAKLFAELKQANRELREQQAQLIEAEKLSALGKIAGGVAHEIGNPMTFILGYTSLTCKELEQGDLTPEEIKTCLDRLRIVEDESERVVQVIRSLSHFYRHREGNLAPTDINRAIETALKIAAFHAKKGNIGVVKDFNPDLPQIMADGNQLQLVFLNLIMNARDAMEEGGTLTIATAFEDGQDVSVRFADTGCGIPPEAMGKIFRPLFTTKEEGAGTGLGLSISHDIVENHQGTIDVESTPGKGTTFTIRLPLEASNPL